ncbi:MAG: hypothetical protein F6J86_37085 [Symploca sp. SIO1B1]|nr:hypothetical protein [Symploca sp. SIO1B1]
MSNPPYQARTIEEQPEEFDTDDIAVHTLSNLQDFETDEEEPIWRGVFTVSRSPKVLFSKEIDLKVNKLPTWKAHVVIDSYRLEDEDELNFA